MPPPGTRGGSVLGLARAALFWSPFLVPALLLIGTLGLFAYLSLWPAPEAVEGTVYLSLHHGTNHCTAFYVGDGLFLSAGHCAASALAPYVARFEDGSYAVLQVLAANALRPVDYAVLGLHPENPPLPKNLEVLDLACDQESFPASGTLLRFEGFPFSFPLTSNWGWSGGSNTQHGSVTTIVTGEGASGGPVIDPATGRVVGTVSAGLTTSYAYTFVSNIVHACEAIAGLVRPKG